MLHQTLWNLNRDIAQSCLECEFIIGITNGTLDHNAFKRYIAQDAFFLRGFLTTYAIAAAKSKTLIQVITFHKLMGGVIDELKLHASLAQRMDINLDQVDPYQETLAYTQFLENIAWKMDVDLITAAITPCMKLYAWLGKTIHPLSKPNNPYSEWIDTYASPEFQELADTLDELLEDLASDTDAVKNTYRQAMQCELDFFNAPLRQQS